MSSYIKSTNFSVKDSLVTGDPLKIVSGSEIDTEFNAIQTAVNSKANTNSPTLTGVPAAPTASAGTNTTQIATTAFVTTALTNYQSVVDAALQALYPVGSVYMNATNNTNPATLIGFGTWVAFGAGRVPVGFDSSNTLFDTAEETGGSYDAVVVEHTHGITDPGHKHEIPKDALAGGVSNFNRIDSLTDPTIKYTETATTGITINSAGESGTNKNVQPYITVYMWKRTA